MNVRIRVQPTGLLNGKPWPAVGDTIVVPDVVAVDLLNANVAEPVEEKREETAKVTPAVQTAVKPNGRPRKNS
jgi:hypothetical protein